MKDAQQWSSFTLEHATSFPAKFSVKNWGLESNPRVNLRRVDFPHEMCFFITMGAPGGGARQYGSRTYGATKTVSDPNTGVVLEKDEGFSKVCNHE